MEPLDDDHAAAAAGAELCCLRLGSIGAIGSIGADCFDGIDGNDWRHEQFAGAGDVLSAFAAGEQAIVADAVEACGQHVDEEAAAPFIVAKIVANAATRGYVGREQLPVFSTVSIF